MLLTAASVPHLPESLQCVARHPTFYRSREAERRHHWLALTDSRDTTLPRSLYITQHKPLCFIYRSLISTYLSLSPTWLLSADPLPARRLSSGIVDPIRVVLAASLESTYRRLALAGQRAYTLFNPGT